MNSYFPDWNFEAELPVHSQKKPLGIDHGLVELLWENGQVVLHSQNHRKPGGFDAGDYRQVNKHDQSFPISGCSGNPANLIQDNGTLCWMNCQVDDPFDKEFSSNFLPEIPLSNPVVADKPMRQLDGDKFCKIDASEVNHLLPYDGNSNFSANPLLPLRFQTFNSAQQHAILGVISKSPNIPSPAKADFGPSNGQLGAKEASNMNMGEVREYSVKTVGSSHCGSNQVVNDADTSRASSCGIGTKGFSVAVVKDYAGKVSSQSERDERETLEPAITSSSGGTGTSFGRTCNQSTGTDSYKRKIRDGEDSECQSEATVLESAARKKKSLKSGTTRKSRAAQVHNLSERKRRDRINEKMKALQELLPHSNKTDKASMLDEAIEYMKSLQLQLQMMWMGSGMAPMMFPGVQHYMSRLGMGIGPPTLPSIHNPMHLLSRLPMVDQTLSVASRANQAAVYQPTVLNPINYQNQLQHSNFPDQYASYMGFHPLQSASQPMNIFSFGSNIAQSHTLAPPGNGSRPSVG